MYIYLVVFVYMSFFSVLEAVNIQKYIRFWGIVSSFFILLLLAGLRYETGVDWGMYTTNFYFVKKIDKLVLDIYNGQIKNQIDFGYIFFTSLIKTIGGSIQTVFFIASIFSLSLLYKNLKVYSENVVLSLLIYYSTIFFVLDMSGMRQCMALALFFLSVKYIFEKKILKYITLTIVGGLFHWSAFFLIPVYWIVNRKYPSKSLIMFFLIELIIFFFKIRWLKSLLFFVFPLITNKQLADKAVAYTISPTYAQERLFNLTTIINIIYLLSIFIFGIINRKKLEMKYKYFNVFFNLFVCNSFIYLCTSELLDISFRMQFYFMIANVILLPLYASIFKRKLEKAAITAMIVLYSLSYSKAYIFENIYTIAYHPYQNYIIYKIFNKTSTGNQRIEIHKKIHRESE